MLGTAIGLVAMILPDLVGDANVVGYEADPGTAEDCRRNMREKAIRSCCITLS